jgi:putative hydrolases of HD superfamily
MSATTAHIEKEISPSTSISKDATDRETPSPSLASETISAVAERILSATALAQQLKCTLRHSWLSNGRQESVAEHTWRMSLIALLVTPHLKVNVDITALLKIVVVHDLVEAIAGDIPVFEVIATPESQNLKRKRETEAMQKIVAMLPEINAAEIQSLWHEFESSSSNEARVAQALDKLEAQIQHNEASLSTWLDIEKTLMNSLETYTRFDPFLDAMRARVVADTIVKLNTRSDG